MDEERLKLIIEAEDRASAALAATARGIRDVDVVWTKAAAAAAAFTGAALAAGYATLRASSAAAEEADQVRRLQAFVEQNGGAWSEWGERIESTAARLQSTTEFSDDQTRTAFTRLIGLTGDLEGSFAGLDAAIGLTRVTEQDLASTSRLVAQAMEGNTQALSRYVPGLRGAIDALGDKATQDEKAAVAMRLLQDQFGGLVTAIDPTKQALAEIRNNTGDVVEAFGHAINAGDGMARVYGATADALKTFERVIVENGDAIRAFVREALLVGVDGLVAFGAVLKEAAKAGVALGSAVFGGAGLAVKGLVELGVALRKAVGADYSRDAAEVGDALLDMSERIGGMIEGVDKGFEVATAAAATVRGAIESMPVHVVKDIEKSSRGAGRGFHDMARGAAAAADAMKALQPESFVAGPEAGLTGSLRANDVDALSNAMDHLGVVSGSAREEQIQFAFAVRDAADQAFAAGTISTQEYADTVAAAQSSLERFGEVLPLVDVELGRVEQRMYEFGSAVSGAVAGVAESFGVLFADLARGKDSPFEAFFSNILAGFGNFLQQFGSGLIAYGIAAQAMQIAIANPLAAIAAGVALVAIGAALSATASGAAQTVQRGRGASSPSFAGSSGPAFRPSDRSQAAGSTTIVNVSLGGNPLLTRDETARAVSDAMAAANRAQARPAPA